MLYKVVLSTIFWVCGMSRPKIEPQFPEQLVNTLSIGKLLNSYRPRIIELTIWIQTLDEVVRVALLVWETHELISSPGAMSKL